MASILPHTRFGPNFKHAKVVEIVIGDMESLSTYPHYWNYHLVPQILSGKFYCYFKLTQGCTCTQVECHHSDLGGSTNGVNSLIILTPLICCFTLVHMQRFQINRGTLCWIA